MLEIFNKDTTLAIGALGIVVSIFLPFVLRIIDYIRHLFRSWRQTTNIRNIVRNAIHDMLNDNPRDVRSTDTGSVGEPVKADVDAARYAHFEAMTFDLQVILDYYSSDISYTKKKHLKYICETLSSSLSSWIKARKGKLPTKDVYETFVIPNVVGPKWLKP
ncbi:MAG: hypothetical protein OXU23_25595 [Candidatus Poribacteria bacterium]|nr:hypothetical protein [Candidatus Poribacteria bacterium]